MGGAVMQNGGKSAYVTCIVSLMVLSVFCLAGGTRAEGTSEYIYCEVELQESTGNLAVEIPENYGEYSVWLLGEVPQGGVADTWFDGDELGHFRVRNAGDTNAHIWIVAEEGSDMEGPFSGNTIPPVAHLPTRDGYALAFATNLMDRLPDWHLLDNVFAVGAGAHLGFLLPGDYLLFDLRFYAPTRDSGGRIFRIGLYAVAEESPVVLP